MNADPKITVMTSREFNQDTARAKRAARKGPVRITERGRPAFVLLTDEEFERMKAAQARTATDEKFRSLAEALEQKEGGDFDFDIPESRGDWGHKIPDFE